MKITIDTKEDSHTEIQKAIRLLQSLVEHKTNHTNIFEDDSPTLPTTDTASSGGLFNMFGDGALQKNTESSESEDKKKEKDDVVQIMEY